MASFRATLVWVLASFALLTSACGEAASSQGSGAGSIGAGSGLIGIPYMLAQAPSGGGVVDGGTWLEISAAGGGQLLGEVFMPSGKGPFPAVVVLHGAEGLRQHNLQLAAELAQHGVVAIAACWFSGYYDVGSNGKEFVVKTPSDGIDCPNANFDLSGADPQSASASININHIVDAVRALPGVDANQVLLLGRSQGATAALFDAANNSHVSGVIAWDYAVSSEVKASIHVPVLTAVGSPDHDVSQALGFINSSKPKPTATPCEHEKVLSLTGC